MRARFAGRERRIQFSRLPLSMKITLVSSGSGSRGGGEIYLRFLAAGLYEAGHTVNVIVPENEDMNEFADSLVNVNEVIRVPFRSTYSRRLRSLSSICDLAQIRFMSSILQSLETDILHINQQVSEDGLDLVLSASMSGKPWVSTIHVGHGAEYLGARFGRLRDRITHRILSRQDGNYIAVSRSSQDQLNERLDAVVNMVANGVAVSSTEEILRARIKARKNWGVSTEDICIGTVGRIEPQKNPLAFIDYICSLSLSGRLVHAIWIGDGSMKDQLVRHADQVSKKIPLTIDGWRDDAAHRLAGLDIFLFPSVFEGLPLALLEAMHAGLPIIASSADGIKEAITHDVSGLICETPDDWKDGLNNLIGDPLLRKKLGARARKRAEQNFSQKSMTEETLKVYTKTLLQFSHVRN